jgi:hypothetical protein
MRSDKKDDAIVTRECPIDVSDELTLVGGVNRFGEPNFRVVWGYNRIVPISGEWQEFEQYKVKIKAVPIDIKTLIGEPLIPVPPKLGIVAGDSSERIVTKLKSSVIETRYVPKYLPANCWHLEMWRPPEEYGSPEQWKTAGIEHLGMLTIDTAGEYPVHGEYELCYPLTSDGTSHGQPIPLVRSVVSEIVKMIRYGRQGFSLSQRRAAIEQRVRREEEGFVNRTQDILRDSLRPFAGEDFIIKP